MTKKQPPQTPAWLRQIVAAFEAVENLRPEPVWFQGDFPAWVTNVGRELTNAIVPTAHLKPGVWEPGEVGALIGQQIAYWHHIGEWLAATLKKKQTEEDERLLDVLKRVYGADFEERAGEFWRVMLEDVAPAYGHAAAMALSIAVQQDYLPMTRFFAAFCKALARKPSKGNAIGRTNTHLHLMMLTNWRRVEELGSIPALHDWLCRSIFLSPQTVGDLKRVEKICERIGLSYRKIAERNQRAIDSDMST